MVGAVAASLILLDERDSLVIRPESATAGDPIVCKQWDLGAPGVREATQDRANADGTVDRASYTGARSVTFDLVLLGDDAASPYAYAERLAAMTHPSRRPILQVRRNTPEATGEVWEMTLRGDPFSIAYGRRAASMLEMQLAFTAPDGYLEGPTRSHVSTAATDGSVLSGIEFGLTFPVDTGSATADNPLLDLTIGGSAPVYPVIYIYGPCVNPELRTEDGERFKFTGLTLNAGDFVQIDMLDGTVLLGGAATASVWHLVDFTVSTFWTWYPGQHVTRFYATSGNFIVEFRERRFTV